MASRPGYEGTGGTLSVFIRELLTLPTAGAASDAPGPAPGEVIAERYEVVREIGRGGFGLVVEAKDRKLHRRVALKFFRPREQPAALDDAAEAEAELVARLSHPNIVPIHDRGSSDAGPFLVLELLEGEPLSRRLARGALAPAEAARLGLEIAHGLEHAHARGVVHRDLKPENVFLCEDGSPKILDFGLGLIVTRTGAALGGTPGWMSPEQLKGRPGDARTDVWALGAILRRALAGSGDGPEAAAPPELARLLQRMLAEDPGQRPQDGRQAAEALAAVVRALDGPPGPARRRAALLAGGAATAALAVAALAWSIVTGRTPPARAEDARPVLAVADLANSTGEPELAALGGLLVTALEQSPRVRVLPRGRVRELLREAGLGEGAPVDETSGREVARRAGAHALLLPAVLRFGDRYTLQLRAVDPRSGEALFSEKRTVDAKRAIPELVDALAEGALAQLGRSAAEEEASRARTLTPNLEAASRFYAGIDDYVAGRYAEATAAWEQAVKMDPDFGAAWVRLAFVRVFAGSGQEELRQAHRLEARIPDRERRILASLTAAAELRWDELVRTATDALARYPEDPDLSNVLGELLWMGWLRGGAPDPVGDLAERMFVESANRDPTNEVATSHVVWHLSLKGRAAESLPIARLAAERKPSVLNLAVLGFGLLDAGRPEEALEPARRAFELGGETNWDTVYTYAGVLFQLGRYDEAVEVLRCPGAPTAGAVLAGALDAARGRLRAALERIRAAPVEPASFWTKEQLAALKRNQALVLPARMGMGEAARAAALASSEPDAESGARTLAAVLWARSGKLDAARAVDLAPESPPDRQLAAAVVACRAGSLEDAARQFQIDRRRNFLAGPYGGYLWAALEWGDCLLDAGRTTEARDRYRAVLAEQHGQLDVAWAFVRARLGLAKALAALGETGAARVELEPLVKLWEGADPGVPVVEEGRALLRKLRREKAGRTP